MARSLILAVVFLLSAASSAGASKLVTLDAPSRHVDPATAAFGGEEPHELKVNVLLAGRLPPAPGVSAALPHARRRREPPLVGRPGEGRRGEHARRARRDHRDARGRLELLHELVERRRARGPGLGALPPGRGDPAARAAVQDPPRPALARDRRFLDGRLRLELPRHPAAGLLRNAGPDVGAGLDPPARGRAGALDDQRRALPGRVGPVGRVLRRGPRSDDARAEPRAHEGDPSYRQRRAAAGRARRRDATSRAGRSRRIS